MGQKKIKAERRRQRELARKAAKETKKNADKSHWRYWPLYVGGTVLTFIGAFVIGVGGGSFVFDSNPLHDYSVSKSDLEEKVKDNDVSEEAAEINFENADSDPRRAEYVKSLESVVEMPHYLASRRYQTKFDRTGKMNVYGGRNPAMVTMLAEGGKWKDIGKKKLHAKTIVLPRAFRSAKNEEEFLFTLRHELNMAKIIYEGFDDVSIDFFHYTNDKGEEKFRSTLFHIVGQLESYGKDIKRALEEGMDEHMINMFKKHYLRYFVILKDVNNPVPKETLEKLQKIFTRDWMHDKDSADIFFTKAKANLNDEAFVQRYLNQILGNIEEYGIEGWDSFGEFIYDPGFKKRDQKGKKAKHAGYLNEARYGDDSNSPDSVSLMCTELGSEMFGKKGRVYINDAALKYCRSEDEFLSSLDNEAFTARGMHKQESHLTVLKPNKSIGEPSIALLRLRNETLSFDLQFFYIENGRRNVSDNYLRMVIPKARGLMKKLFEIAESGTVDGEYAQGILATLGRRPTIKYFMPNIKNKRGR
jgi:hypothetical protein